MFKPKFLTHQFFMPQFILPRVESDLKPFLPIISMPKKAPNFTAIYFMLGIL